MHQSSLIPTKTLDEIKVEQLLMDIQVKRVRVADMTLALEDLKLDVRRFEKEYSARLAQFYFELDKVELLTKEYRLRLRLLQEGIPGNSPEMEARIEACFRTERERLANSERGDRKERAAEESKPLALPAEQMKQFRTLYLRLAKRYHPDKARRDGERDTRMQMMTLINRAYEEQDVQTLERMSSEVMPEAEPASATIHERKQQLIEEMNQLMHTIGNLQLEINQLKSSPTYRLKEEVEKAHENGVDLLINLTRDLRRKINASKRGLTSLIERFHRFSKNRIKQSASVF